MADAGAVADAGPVTGRAGGRAGGVGGGSARARLRAWSAGWTAGAAHTLGAALLMITECVRQDVAGLGEKVPPGAELPHYAADFRHLVDVLGGQWWFRAAEDVRDAVAFGEPRAALWAAVCAALVVRGNPQGPPRLQGLLSLVGAFYCVVAAVAGLPYLALAGPALPFALVIGAVALAVATPAWWRRALGREGRRPEPDARRYEGPKGRYEGPTGHSVASAAHSVRLPPSTFQDQ
ncbi:hypothetical protein MMF93_21250 [Streptomyces tubbatahanensis]|uniref:Uncharacterized protein n=1 Tax=Streptomyces tubbatahanensis TaxID=2923272 RepID=A0ABY3XXA0_9ACTN|nr:hypothetical protein [Streptomyces tubbatahanensis]UNS98703.1 hypothetical protein MMF93_21250 [Streptomyces tubbatahanensis]